MEDKLLTFVARLVAAIITGGGLLSFTNGAWIGRLMLNSFEQSTGISILNPHLISDDLYREWGREILFGSARSALGVAALVYVALALVLLGHVLFKAVVNDAHVPNVAGQSRAIRLARRLCAVYVRQYHLLTGILVMLLTVMLLAAPSRGALATRFIVFAVPVVAYLVYYVKDVRGSSFKDVFLYGATLLLFAFTLVALPVVYGERFFDVWIRQVPPIGDTKGPDYLASFIVDEKQEVVCHVYGQETLTLELQKVIGVRPGITAVSLRTMATETAARRVADPRQVSPAIDRLLRRESAESGNPRQ